MQLWIIAMLAVLASCFEQTLLQNSDLGYEIEELAKVEHEIQRRTSKNHHLQLKLSRLFQHSIKHSDANLSIADIRLLPSISVPYKDNIYYSMLLKRKGNIYTLRGDAVLQQQNYGTLISTIRNQHTYFAEMSSTLQIKISKLKVINKKIHIQFEINIHITNFTHLNIDFFVVAAFTTGKYYIFASSIDKIILIFEKNGTLSKSIVTNQTIKQIKKINNNIVILTEDELFFLNINKNFNKTSCLLPYGSIEYFEYDESNLRYVYGINKDSIFQFQLSNHCRPINRFFILPNSSFTVAGQVIFLSTPSIKYAINKTDGQAQLYLFPFGECNGSQKIEINRKIQNSYIASQICLSENQISMAHILIQLEDTLNQVTDFSKFRIPLLFFSFGIIIYVTVKNKNKNKPEEEDQNAIQQSILKKISSLQDKNLTKPSKFQQNRANQQPIFEKKQKKM